MLVTVVLIVLSLVFGSALKLRARYRRVTDAFYNGTDKSGMNISSELADREETARNLITVARRYQNSEAVDKAVSACDELSRQKGIAEKYAANKKLSDAVYALYREMEDWDLSDKDAAYRTQLYARFTSINDTISHDGYNKLAAEYNSMVSRFPANLASVVGGVTRAPLFSE